jgi:hypothetical protein
MVPAVVVQGVAGLALCAEAAAMLEVPPILVSAASPLSGWVGASGSLFVEIQAPAVALLGFLGRVVVGGLHHPFHVDHELLVHLGPAHWGNLGCAGVSVQLVPLKHELCMLVGQL